MSRFVEIGNVLVNTDAIINVHKGRDGYTTYILKDGKREVIESTIADYDIIKGESVIVQVVPVQVPTYAIYDVRDFDDVEGELVEERVYYLALTSAGKVRPLCLSQYEGYCFADDDENFIKLEERNQ